MLKGLHEVWEEEAKADASLISTRTKLWNEVHTAQELVYDVQHKVCCELRQSEGWSLERAMQGSDEMLADHFSCCTLHACEAGRAH